MLISSPVPKLFVQLDRTPAGQTRRKTDNVAVRRYKNLPQMCLIKPSLLPKVTKTNQSNFQYRSQCFSVEPPLGVRGDCLTSYCNPPYPHTTVANI